VPPSSCSFGLGTRIQFDVAISQYCKNSTVNHMVHLEAQHPLLLASSKQLRFSPSMVCLHSALLIEPADCSFIATQWSSTMICCSHPLLHPEPGPQAQPRQFAWISLALLELIMLSTVLSSTFTDLWPSQPFSELSGCRPAGGVAPL
jgi:hypothetical protein